MPANDNPVNARFATGSAGTHASSAPRASSQPRVNDEKYAVVGSVARSAADSASDRPPITTAATPTDVARRRAVTVDATSRTTIGQRR